MGGLRLSVLARMALSAYDPSPHHVGFAINPFVSANISGYTARQKNLLVVVFCGTNDALDWITNFDAFMVSGPFGRLHAGFNQAVESVWQQVTPQFASAKEIYFVGHSLGGAMAAIAASQVMENASFSVRLCTFGQPRCGDRRWGKAMSTQLGSRYLRVCNLGDPVPHVPGPWRFGHAGELILFGEDGRLTTPKMGHHAWPALKGLIQTATHIQATLHKHDMHLYLDHVKRMEKGS